ncbi:hypothetical protein Tco_0058943 [Tanacetum coccineum]
MKRGALSGTKLIGAQGHRQDLSDGCENCLSLWQIDERYMFSTTEVSLDPKYPEKVYKVLKLCMVTSTPKSMRTKLDDPILVQDYVDDIIFGFYKNLRFQVTPKTSHLSAVKRIFSGSSVDERALISLTDDLSLLSNMAALESCPKHNMIAYMEKTEGNVEFHEVIDFLRRSYIYHALTHVDTTKPRNQLLKAKITKLKKQAKPVIKHHKAYLKSVSLQQRFPRKSFSKKHRVHKESVSKQGRKIAKGESSVQRDPLFDVMPEDKIDRHGNRKRLRITDEQVEGTEEHNEGTEDQTKEEIATQASQTSTQTPTSMIFGDDETIATLLLNMSQAKAASKETESIDPKDKGKKKIEEEDESESEDDDIPQAVKKFKQLESDEEMARKIQEEWEAEEERNRIAEEKATNEALIKNFNI